MHDRALVLVFGAKRVKRLEKTLESNLTVFTTGCSSFPWKEPLFSSHWLLGLFDQLSLSDMAQIAGDDPESNPPFQPALSVIPTFT